jgi:hypothetical protein
MTRHIGLSHDEVAHRWANDPEGNDHGRGHNMYFEGGVIYSYVQHFPVARHVTNERGEKAVLFTTNTYGVSTAKRKTITLRACRHLNIFHVPNIFGPSDTHMQVFQADYDNEIERLERLNCNPYVGPGSDLFLRLEAMQKAGNDYAAFFDLDDCVVPAFKAHLDWIAARYARLTSPEAAAKRSEQARRKSARLLELWAKGEDVYLPGSLEPTELERDQRKAALTIRCAAYIAEFSSGERGYLAQELIDCATPEQRAQRLAFEHERDKDKIAAWRQGENVYFGYGTNVPCLLRLNGDTVETSWHASFRVKDAKLAFRLVERVRKSGQCWKPNGEKSPALGHYKIDRVAADGTVRAGCHTVAWSEIERIAKELELI